MNSLRNFLKLLWKIGHAILAYFENTLSKVYIDRFVSILEQEERSATIKGLDQLSEIHKIKYGLWKGLIQRYFGTILSKLMKIKYKCKIVFILFKNFAEIRSKPLSQESTAKKLDLGPVPCLPCRSDRKRELSSPILTGERAKRQLAEQESRKQERQKRTRKIGSRRDNYI